jgi:hypothetical protein
MLSSLRDVFNCVEKAMQIQVNNPIVQLILKIVEPLTRR